MIKTFETLKLFEGTHNFSSFAMRKVSRIAKVIEETGEKKEIVHEPIFFTRTVEKVRVDKIDSPESSKFNPIYDLFDFYTAEFTGIGFFHHQVSLRAILYCLLCRGLRIQN